MKDRSPGWNDLALVSGLPALGSFHLTPDSVDLAIRLGEGSDARKLDMPLVLTDDSGGRLSPQARLALVQAAKRKGCALRLEDPTSDLVELAGELGVPVWLVVGPRRTAALVEALGSASVVELQMVSLDAGGTMTASVDARTGDGSMEVAVPTLRSVAGGAPVVVNVGPSSDREVLRHAASSGAEAIMVRVSTPDGAAGPVGPGPLSAISGMRRAIARAKLPEGARAPMVVAYNGVWDGLELVKALALGADLVVMGTPLRTAMGCTLCDECGPGVCPSPGTGAPTDWRALTDRLVDLLDGVEARARSALAGIGCGRSGDASIGNLEARTYDAAAVTGAPLAGYGEVLPMWHH